MRGVEQGFSGSYAPEDVTFLLKQVQVRELAVDDKERFIQRGGHYSEVITPEKAPSEAYLQLFERQLARSTARVAADALYLAQRIHEARPSGPVTVISLARAGTPVGVLVHRALQALLGRESTHYCVSIIRDRGLDLNALTSVCQRHAPQSLVFIDGWTGKGVIGRELARSVAAFNAAGHGPVDPSLFVLADIAGTAAFAATHDDYLLPSAVLNAPVSGLVSRTVLNEQVGAEDFHGCAYLAHLEACDQSRRFVDVIWTDMRHQRTVGGSQGVRARPQGDALREALSRYQALYDLQSPNLLKPGVGEATRVMLRRKPLLLVLRDYKDAHVEHLLHLASERRVAVCLDTDLPCRALALIDQPD